MRSFRIRFAQTPAPWNVCRSPGRQALSAANSSGRRSTVMPLTTDVTRIASVRADSANLTRAFSSQAPAPAVTSVVPPLPPARWLADLRARVGKCILHGCSPEQISEATVVARALATEWRRLTAGSEGYLIGGRRGLEDQKVVWGEMDSFVCVPSVSPRVYRLAPGGPRPRKSRSWVLLTEESIVPCQQRRVCSLRRVVSGQLGSPLCSLRRPCAV